MSAEKVGALILKIEKYFKENPVSGYLRMNDYSQIHNVKNYIEANIGAMRRQKVGTKVFNNCYERLTELKNFLEKRK